MGGTKRKPALTKTNLRLIDNKKLDVMDRLSWQWITTALKKTFIHLQYTLNILNKNRLLFIIFEIYVLVNEFILSYYLPRIIVITIMRFLEDDVIVGDKLIPFLVANDVFELVPEKATSNVLQTFQTQWNYDNPLDMY